MVKKKESNRAAASVRPPTPLWRRVMAVLGHHPVASTLVATAIIAAVVGSKRVFFERPSLSVVVAPLLEELSSYRDSNGAVIHQWILSDPMRGSCRMRRFVKWSHGFSDVQQPSTRFSLKLLVANTGDVTLSDVIVSLTVDSIGAPSVFTTPNVQAESSIGRNLNAQLLFQTTIRYLRSGDTAVVTFQQDGGWLDGRFAWGELSYSSRETERRAEPMAVGPARLILDAERRLYGGDMLLPRRTSIREWTVGEHWIYTALQEDENDSRLHATGTCGYEGPEREPIPATTLPPLDSTMIRVLDPPTTSTP